MKNHSILFTAPCVAEYLETDMPAAGAGEVLVEIARTAISSGTERANLVGEANTNSTKPGEVKFPRICGYSAAGIVKEVGEGVASVKPGDRVACIWTKHRQYCVLPEENVFPLPDTVSFDEATLMNIATFPLAAIRKCRLEIGESAVVMGQGILGQFAVLLLRAAGAAPIIAVDPVPEKRARALTLGADFAFDPFAPDFASEVKRLTCGGAAVAIEVTGNGRALDQVLDCMRPRGRVALLGCTRDPNFAIDYYRKVHGPGITLVGAHTQARPHAESYPGYWTAQDDVRALIHLVNGGRLSLAALIEERHVPTEAPTIFKRLAEEPAFPIVIFDWSNEK